MLNSICYFSRFAIVELKMEKKPAYTSNMQHVNQLWEKEVSEKSCRNNVNEWRSNDDIRVHLKTVS